MLCFDNFVGNGQRTLVFRRLGIPMYRLFMFDSPPPNTIMSGSKIFMTTESVEAVDRRKPTRF